MDALARLALADALQKACRGLTDPRRPGSARAAADDSLRDQFERNGVDRIRIQMAGRTVGTLSARISKPREGVEPRIADSEALVRWLRESDGGLDSLRRLVYGEPALVLEAATKDGELPDGCYIEKVEEPPRWLGTTLRVDPEKVAGALGESLPWAVKGLLDVGEGEVG